MGEGPTAAGTALLERGSELGALCSALSAALRGRGAVVLVSGEAGAGKSSLIRSFVAGAGARARVLVGACDDLSTPRTLGPVRDAFSGCSARLDRALAGGTRDDLFGEVLGVLGDPPRPTVLVVEDIHWADDATLDLLGYLGRRIEGTATVLVVSYREDEVGRDHPVQRLLGRLGGAPVARVRPAPLSPAAVATLAGTTEADSAQLYRLTGGNPFYVTEALAAGGAAVPATVVDAVLARLRGLSPTTRTVLDRLAVVPTRVDVRLARALVGDLDVLAESERRGVLEVRAGAVAFRHELARRVIESSLTAGERMHAHARVLEALLAADEPDGCRIVHHAVRAGDDATVVGALQAFGHGVQVLRGEWQAALPGLRRIVEAGRTGERGSARFALPCLAGLLARLGSPDAADLLRCAQDSARRADSFSDWWWTGLAEIEAAWLDDRPDAAADTVARLDELTARPGRTIQRGELQRWRRRLGMEHHEPPGCPPLWALGIGGDWRAAAAGWEALGLPYHRALELLDSGEAGPTLHAIEILDDLGAGPAARIARGRVRALGVPRPPRGPARSTRRNPAGLTARQVDVVRLVAEGLTNAEIAARLVISEKTADHHVSAVLAKLAVPSRRDAAREAWRLGLARERRRSPRVENPADTA